VPLATAEEVLRLYREVYHDLNMRHFHEKLREEHRIERNFGTWQGRLPQGLRLAGIIRTVEQANRFPRERYNAELNGKFAVAAEEKGTASRRCSRTDLSWIFTVQTERVVAKDNTVAIGDRRWRLEKARFRHTLAAR